jgi:hypothetical protein
MPFYNNGSIRPVLGLEGTPFAPESGRTFGLYNGNSASLVSGPVSMPIQVGGRLYPTPFNSTLPLDLLSLRLDFTPIPSPGAAALPAAVRLSGASRVAGEGPAVTLADGGAVSSAEAENGAGRPAVGVPEALAAENSFERPDRVMPRGAAVDGLGPASKKLLKPGVVALSHTDAIHRDKSVLVHLLMTQNIFLSAQKSQVSTKESPP